MKKLFFLLLLIIVFFNCSEKNMESGNDSEPYDEPWIKKADLLNGRHSFTSSAVSDKIYLFGGRYTEDIVTEYNSEIDT